MDIKIIEVPKQFCLNESPFQTSAAENDLCIRGNTGTDWKKLEKQQFSILRKII